jgi:type 2 lantibiotic biosynthesis protein LanM
MANAAPEFLSARSEALSRIAARATFLHERLAAAEAPYGDGEDGDGMLALTRWRTTLGAGGVERRLAWDGIDATAVLWQQGSVHALADADWIGVLGDALAQPIPVAAARYLDPSASVAFEELLVPFIEAARQELQRGSGEALDLLSKSAQITLERSLLLLLSSVALSTFNDAFALHQSLCGRFPWADYSGSDHAYQRFVSELRNGGLLKLLGEHAVLARLLASVAYGWAKSHAQLVRRLRQDWPALRQMFNLAAACRIDSIAPYRSDPHDGGQAVVIVVLAGGLALVYKPRTLDMERGLGEVLAWSTACGFSKPYRIPALLPRNGYGWMEHVAATSCSDMLEIAAFYTRAGGLLCLTALLQGTDIHYENLIACGDQPIIVDPETLFHPRLPQEHSTDLGAGTGRGEACDDFARTLSESGFLPTGLGPDFSAFGAVGPIKTPYRVVHCAAVNSDAMAVDYKTYCAPSGKNVPTLNGRPETAAKHRDLIVSGFSEMFRLVLNHRTSLLDVLRGFAGRRGRFVARSTNIYGLLLQASLGSELMRNGATRGILFERLRRAAVERPQRPACWPILDAELQALERMDIPFFASVCDEATAYWPSPMDQVTARIVSATEADLTCYVQHLEQGLSRLPTPAPAIVSRDSGAIFVDGGVRHDSEEGRT